MGIIPLTKTSDNGKVSITLKKVSNKFVIFKSQAGARDAEFADKLAEFSDEEKARKYFEKIKL